VNCTQFYQPIQFPTGPPICRYWYAELRTREAFLVVNAGFVTHDEISKNSNGARGIS